MVMGRKVACVAALTDGDEHGDEQEGGVRRGVDVGVARLVQLHHHQHRRHVHERRVCKPHTLYRTTPHHSRGVLP